MKAPTDSAVEVLYTIARIYEEIGYVKPYTRRQRFRLWLHSILFPDCDGCVW